MKKKRLQAIHENAVTNLLLLLDLLLLSRQKSLT